MEPAKGAKTNTRGPTKAKLTWRSLTLNDINDVIRIANNIHPDLPESIDVFSERIKLFPEGCLGLEESNGKTSEIYGYAISHPIIRRQPPALNSLLGEISPGADQYYIHDLALLPEARGRGSAQEGVEKLLAISEGYGTTALVSVYGSAPFWNRFGFVAGETDEVLEKKLREYGEDSVFLERKNGNYN
ncbi:Nn.00g044840.m01.CDS01 [Neocucurbitaria sp. VM-36]